LTQIDTSPFLKPLGLVATTDTANGSLAISIGERFGAKRAIGTAAHAIEFTVLAAVLAPLAIHFARYATHRYTRVFARLASVISLLAVPVGVSRSGIIALAAALFIYMWNVKLRSLAVAFVAGAAIFLASFAIAPNIGQALWKTIANSSEDSSVLSRVAATAKVSQTFHDNPVFGLGIGGAIPSIYGFLDNQWMQAIVQGGLLGLLAMLVVAGAAAFGFASGLRRASDACQRDECYAMGAMLMGILASSFTFDLFGFPQIAMMYFLLLGLMWSCTSITVGHDGMDHAPPTPTGSSPSTRLTPQVLRH
jgi:O-antigen ligase